mmetsp:Transcript_3320/g.6121  ORF Transcript_3320/g.6121 Transcript_3320/m.6121 type:complete len:106 (+) Transcript_3320:167-484(+)
MEFQLPDIALNTVCLTGIPVRTSSVGKKKSVNTTYSPALPRGLVKAMMYENVIAESSVFNACVGETPRRPGLRVTIPIASSSPNFSENVLKHSAKYDLLKARHNG